jgi:3-oxoacyl-(acyl-carrier-protein) synthase
VGIDHYEAGAEQMRRAMEKVLSRGGVSAADVDYISAAANSTPELDRAEAIAIERVESASSRPIPVSSLKGHIGDFCGAGALRAAAILLAMREGRIPPTLGLKTPELDLDHIMGQPREARIQYALLNGFSFGGSNVCLLFKKEQ